MKTKISNDEHQKMFSTELKCLNALLHFRKSKDGLCFNKDCKAPIDTFYVPLSGRKAFLCRRCLGHFHPMVDSLFEHSRIDLVHWFQAMYEMLSCRNGIATKELERRYGYGYPAMFRMTHAIRELMGKSLQWNFDEFIVEIDESYVSTGNKGLGRHYKFPRGRGSAKNTNILVITGRMGKAKLFVIPSSEADSIIPLIEEQIDKTSIIATDEWGAYNSLTKRGYEHVIVQHSDPNSKTRYKNGIASTNSAENIFSTIKRSVRGTYKSVSEKYLQKYLFEFAFRHSYRNEKDYGFSELMKQLKPLSDHYTNDALLLSTP